MTATLEISPLATDSAMPSLEPPAGSPTNNADHESIEAQLLDVGVVAPVPSRQPPNETQAVVAAGAPTPSGGHGGRENQNRLAVRGPFLADPFLGVLASTVDDLENTRKATANRLRQLTRAETDKDGHLRGLGMDESSPEVAMVAGLLEALEGIEHKAILKLNGQMRKHALWKFWGKSQKGVGEKQLARLLASIGDPYWNDLHERPRTVSELWSYCGYAVVRPSGQLVYGTPELLAGGTAPKKQRGAKVNWSGDARMRTWNIAGSCLKAQGYYADVYYEAREKYSESTHSVECARCGPAGKPAQVGSALSDGHKHARAIRIMCKEILRDLWVAAKELHEA